MNSDPREMRRIDEPAARQDQTGTQPLPDWCNVYEELSDQEVAEIEKVILMRADVTRTAE